MAIALKDYDFTAPPGWLRQESGDHIELRSPELSCLILLLEPQAASGDLEQDAQSVFDLMYPSASWDYRNAGDKQFTFERGLTAQGLSYCLLDAEMSMTDAAGFHPERGVAWVIKVDGQLAIIAARHNDFLFAHDNCYKKYDYWPRFFDSLTIANVAPTDESQSDVRSRIIGRWTSEGSGLALGEYVFRGDGTYLRGGALGTSSVHSDGRVETTTHTVYSGDGDGRFSLEGNRLILMEKDGREPEEARIRIVEINQSGSGWKDRLYMVKDDPTGAYQVNYARSDDTVSS